MDTFLSVLPLVLILAICPLAMAVMMRGGHGAHTAPGAVPPTQRHGSSDRERIEELEAEVAELRRAFMSGDGTPSTAGGGRGEAAGSRETRAGGVAG